MKFDKDKCLKLLKERKSLQKEGKLLRDYDKAKNDELINYLSLVEDEIFWESGKEYIQILDLFVSKNITLDQFFTQFCGLRGSNLKSARMWKNNLEEASEYKRFDLYIQQGLAWKRLETGTHELTLKMTLLGSNMNVLSDITN